MLFRCDCGVIIKEILYGTFYERIICPSCGQAYMIDKKLSVCKEPRKTMILPDKECASCLHRSERQDLLLELTYCTKKTIPKKVCFHDVCSHYQPK